MDTKIIGYKIGWATSLNNVYEFMDIEGWIYPDGMIERLVYLDEECLIFRFPQPMTKAEIKAYDPTILNEKLGYELIKELPAKV
ncbi:MAG: hypothetical protein HUJ25_07605 [Crocinitomicaceae bacterium]|nr:hypothetical protein [Crocinitomicaceae bacterium]